LNFQELVEKFHEKQKQREELIAMKEQQEEIKLAEQRKHNCYEAIQKQRIAKAKQAEMYAKLKPIKLPKPSTSSGSNECKMFKDNTGLNKKIAIETMNKIDNFEANLASRKLKSIAGDNETATSSLKSELIQSSKEEAERRKERETRRRKVLMAQIKAIHDQEERNRELMLQDRLTRQCLQEKRIVTQLMQIRKEKDNIRNNRILRLKQFEEERDKEFQRSLDMEASEARRINEEQQVLFKARQEKRQLLLQKKAQENYQKHYNICQNIMSQILDLCIKTVEYRKLTQNLIPAKLMRDWKVLFLTGKPLYEDYIDGCNLDVESSMASGGSTEDKRDSEEVLDDVDIQEYLHMKHEWKPTDPSISPPSPSPILTHIVHRLIDINNPPKTPPEPPNFPKFYLKAAFVGLPFTGKTTILNKLYIKYGIEILTPSELILKAIETYKSEIAPSQTTLPTSDEEDKPMDIDDDTTSIQPNLSSLGTLGELAHNLIVNGEAVDDATLVDIIVHEIKNLPDGNGWILDNFPITLEQAQLLSIGLTGQTPSAMKEHSDNAQLRSHHFILISEREVNEEELLNLNAVCGLDLVLHFHAAHESVFQRSVLTNEDAIGKPDIQQSLLAFDTHWPKLRKWYQNYRTLQIVNANKELENLYVEVLDIIETKLSKSKQVETMKKFGLKVNNELLNSKSMTRMNMASVSSPTKIELNEASLSKLRPRKVRRPSSAGNTKPKSKSTKKQESKAAAVNTGVLVSVESELFDLFDVNAEPGQEGWIYSSLPVNPLLAPSLAQRWPEAEKLYVLAFKETFCSLRQERDTMCHYIFDKRNEFYHYLKRADNKQKFISQWQASYNTITLELRQSDLMKCEFHRQVDDLCDKLWSICDEHKLESENERQTIIDDQWLPDHIGVISNHYISLMQAELARFQDAILLLKDYYTSMSNAMPQEIPDMSNRLPLIELPLHCPRHDSASPSSSKDNENEPVKEEEQVESKENETENEEENCIPLMARQTPSVPETTSTDDNTNIKAKKKNTTEQEISLPCPPPEDLTNLDLDDQLIVHNYNTAIAISYKLLNNEIHLIEEATAEANKPPVIAAPVQEEKSPGKKGKKSPVGKKGKSPTGKGKKAAPEPEKAEPSTPAVIAPSPEELAQKQKMELMRKEHTAALKHEEMTLNVRLTLIKNKALEFINYFKNKVNEMYVEMEQWIDKRYQQEIQRYFIAFQVS
jgi:adenylate kinase family enzyme